MDREQAARGRPGAQPRPLSDRVQDGDRLGQDRRDGHAHRLAALNKLANPQDKRFSDTFLVVTPGITIRDRLQVLRPNLAGNYYSERDLLPPDQLHALQAAKIEIANFHGFIRRETFEAASLTKKVLAGPDGDTDRFKETPDQVVRRVCRALGTKRNIVVLNDEAHHCYQSAPQSEEEKLSADERAEARRHEEAARVWLNGLRAVGAKLGVRAIYDLSATPFFLRAPATARAPSSRGS